MVIKTYTVKFGTYTFIFKTNLVVFRTNTVIFEKILVVFGTNTVVFRTNTVRCWMNIRIFEYIRIYLDEYIHSSKYSLIFSKANIFGYSFVIYLC